MGFFDKLFNAAKAAVENTAAESTTEKAEEKTAEQPTQPEVTTPQTEKIRFGSPAPVPYKQEINGAEVTLYVRYNGMVEFDIIDPAIVQKYGGIEKVKNDIIKETCIVTDILVQKCSNEEHYPVYRLSSRSSEIAHRIMEPSRFSWREIYGVELIHIGFENIILTQESKETYDKLRRAQMEQAFVQQPAQPQTPATPAAWQCPYCGAQNTSKFCTNCGAKQGQ